MTKWRNRVGTGRLQSLLQETIALAKRERSLSAQDLAWVNVDTTVQMAHAREQWLSTVAEP